jgi:DDE family transposase
MLLHSAFDSFLEKRPICVMARAVLENMLNPKRMDELFARTAQRQYKKDLLFSTLVELMSEVTLKIQPSVHAAYQSRSEEIQTSITAIYKKLGGVETCVSAELVRDSAQQAAAVIDALGATLPPWLKGYRCKILDGNHLAATEHRLEELRTTWSGALPGRALAVFDPERLLVANVVLTEDGHASERSLLDEVIEMVRPCDLWIADRNFCTLKFLFEIARRLGFFVIRQHGALHGELVGKRRCVGKSTTGTVYEQELRITDPDSGKTKSVRRITVELNEPTRDKEWELHVLTNLPVKDADALQVAELYRKRWTIETAFQEITLNLGCEISTLAYPPAALFAFSLALLAYNAVSVLKAALRVAHGEQKVQEEVSGYYMALEIQQASDGMAVAISDELWEPFCGLTPKRMARWLCQVAKGINLSRYKKHPRGPKKKQPKRTFTNGGHVSTAKLIGYRRPR